MLVRLFTLFLFVFVFFSCEKTEVLCDCVAEKVPSGRWYFIGYVKENNISIAEVKPQHPYDTYLQFDEVTKTMKGKMAVNLISSNYTFENRRDDFRGNDLKFSQLGSTKIAVSQAEGQFELVFYEKLSRITSYEINENGTLLLFEKKPNTNETMIFRKQNI